MTTVDLRDLSVTEKVRTSVGAQVALVPGRDRLLVTDVAARKITVLSDPVAVPISTANDTATVVEDHSVEINVLANDSVGGAESPTVRVVTGPANGTVEVSGSGTLTYTPNRDFFGTDAITYNVVDGETSSNVATVVVTVNPLDDPTVIVLDWDAVTDLDSHLTGPGPDGTRFHVFFQNLTHDEDGADPVDVELFNDDLTGVTVETTQINVLRPGDYHFYVRNFTRASVSGTGAKVVVTDVDDPELNVTFVAGGAPGQYWSVFKLTVSTTGAVTITPIDTYGDTEPTLDLVDA